MNATPFGRLPTAALVAVCFVVFAAAVALGAAGVARANTVSVLSVAAQQSGISVCGHGTATATPDRAHLTAGVRAEAADAEGARSQAAQAMAAVIAALKSNGVADQDIQTAYLSVAPDYKYDSGGQHVVGYVATNSVSVTIRAVEKAGQIVDAVTAAGGNYVQVSGIQFTTSDTSQGQAQAQTAALQNAKRQAQAIASEAGVGLGAPVSIQVGGCGQRAVPIYGAADTSAQSAQPQPTTPVQAGQQEVTADIAVVYAIR